MFKPDELEAAIKAATANELSIPLLELNSYRPLVGGTDGYGLEPAQLLGIIQQVCQQLHLNVSPQQLLQQALLTHLQKSLGHRLSDLDLQSSHHLESFYRHPLVARWLDRCTVNDLYYLLIDELIAEVTRQT